MSYRSVEEIYEKIDDCLYEPMNDEPVQEQLDTPVVGGSVGDKAMTSCPAYEATTSFSATGMSVFYLTLILHCRCHFLPPIFHY